MKSTLEFRRTAMQEQKAKDAKAPKKGDPAPDFTLQKQDGSGEITLSQFRGEKPVALIFGSYT